MTAKNPGLEKLPLKTQKRGKSSPLLTALRSTLTLTNKSRTPKKSVLLLGKKFLGTRWYPSPPSPNNLIIPFHVHLEAYRVHCIYFNRWRTACLCTFIPGSATSWMMRFHELLVPRKRSLHCDGVASCSFCWLSRWIYWMSWTRGLLDLYRWMAIHNRSILILILTRLK